MAEPQHAPEWNRFSAAGHACRWSLWKKVHTFHKHGITEADVIHALEHPSGESIPDGADRQTGEAKYKSLGMTAAGIRITVVHVDEETPERIRIVTAYRSSREEIRRATDASGDWGGGGG